MIILIDKMKYKLLLQGKHKGDCLIIEPKINRVNFTIKCDNDGFEVSTDKYKLREICELSDAKTIPAIRKCPKKLGMRFRR